MSVTPVTTMSASQNNANVITNSNFFTLAAELRREMLDRVDAEPGSPVERDFYIIGDSPTGSSASWTDNAKLLALFLGGDWFTWVPARGQIYTKPDGTAVEWDGTDWITPSSGGSLRSGLLTLSANQTTDLDVGDPIQFDQQEAGGDLDFDAVNFQITLRQDVRVRLESAVFCGFTNSSGRADIRFYDVTNATFIGITSIVYPTNGGGSEATQQNAVVYLVPSTDIIVELRVDGETNFAAAEKAFCWLFCQELS